MLITVLLSIVESIYFLNSHKFTVKLKLKDDNKREYKNT